MGSKTDSSRNRISRLDAVIEVIVDYEPHIFWHLEICNLQWINCWRMKCSIWFCLLYPNATSIAWFGTIAKAHQLTAVVMREIVGQSSFRLSATGSLCLNTTNCSERQTKWTLLHNSATGTVTTTFFIRHSCLLPDQVPTDLRQITQKATTDDPVTISFVSIGYYIT